MSKTIMITARVDPNTETAQAIEAALAGINLYKAESVDALFDDLGA